MEPLTLPMMLTLCCCGAGVRRVDGLRCLDVMREMEEGLLLLTGGRDKRGGPLLTFPQSPRRERARPEDYKKLLDYLVGVPW
jgi:triple functional domain protein